MLLDKETSLQPGNRTPQQLGYFEFVAVSYKYPLVAVGLYQTLTSCTESLFQK